MSKILGTLLVGLMLMVSSGIVCAGLDLLGDCMVHLLG